MATRNILMRKSGFKQEMLKYKTELEGILEKYNEIFIPELDAIDDRKKEFINLLVIDPSLNYTNNTFATTTMTQYIQSQYNAGLANKDEYNALIKSFDAIKKEMNIDNERVDEIKTEWTVLKESNTNSFESMKPENKDSIDNILLEIQTIIDKISLDDTIQQLNDQFVEYLSKLRTNINLKIIELYNSTASAKLSVIKSLLNTINGNSSSKNILNAIQDQDGIIVKILELKYITERVKRIFDKNNRNNENTYSKNMKNELKSIQDNIKKTYNKYKPLIKNITTKYSNSVTREVNKLSEQLTNLGQQLLSSIKGEGQISYLKLINDTNEISKKLSEMFTNNPDEDILNIISKIIAGITTSLTLSPNSNNIISNTTGIRSEMISPGNVAKNNQFKQGNSVKANITNFQGQKKLINGTIASTIKNGKYQVNGTNGTAYFVPKNNLSKSD